MELRTSSNSGKGSEFPHEDWTHYAIDPADRKKMEDRLLRADRMAAIGTLAAGVAHEINNPLTYVISSLELIREFATGTNAGSPEILRDIRALSEQAIDGTERVRKIVRDVKAFSRGDEDKLERVDLKDVLRMSVAMAHSEIKHRARLVCDFQETDPVRANESRLCQVFLNLLINAAQAIPEGNAGENVITVSIRQENRVWLCVDISDTGKGIPEAILPRIFEPFFTTKPVGVGTGLGLAVCHGIITALGGEVRVKSRVGAGTTFTIRLPASPGPIDRLQASPPISPERPNARGRILIIDDEPMVARGLKQLLRGEHDVSICFGGQDALELLLHKGESFDLIFCDLMMPKVSGMDLYRSLSSRKPGLCDRVIFMTGGAFTSSSLEFLRSVPNPRIEKPFGSGAIRSLVQDLLQGNVGAATDHLSPMNG